MINQVHGSSPGLTIPCYVRRAADGFYYDWVSTTFVSSPVTGHGTANLVASTVNPSDYILSIVSTPLSVWPDGKYTATAMYGNRSKTMTFYMVNGSDSQTTIMLPWGTVQGSPSATSLQLSGGTLAAVNGIYGPSGGSAPILGARLKITSSATTSTAFGHNTPNCTSHSYTAAVGPTSAFHSFGFASATPLNFGLFSVGDVVTVLI